MHLRDNLAHINLQLAGKACHASQTRAYHLSRRDEGWLTADQLDADIQDELKRRGARAINDQERQRRDEADASRE